MQRSVQYLMLLVAVFVVSCADAPFTPRDDATLSPEHSRVTVLPSPLRALFDREVGGVELGLTVRGEKLRLDRRQDGRRVYSFEVSRAGGLFTDYRGAAVT